MEHARRTCEVKGRGVFSSLVVHNLNMIFSLRLKRPVPQVNKLEMKAHCWFIMLLKRIWMAYGLPVFWTKFEKKNSLKIECVCSESTLAKSTAKEAGLIVIW